MAVITATLAAMTYFVVRAECGVEVDFFPLCSGDIPIVQKYASMVMMDTLLAVLSCGRFCVLPAFSTQADGVTP